MGKFVFAWLLFCATVACGSQAMTNLVDASSARACFAAYTNNVLRIEAVDEAEWNADRRIDRMPFDMPFQLAVGPAAADRAAADAALAAVTTSMPTHVRAFFERHCLLAPLLQRMIRRYKPGVSNEAQYVTAAAHPNVWRAKDFDPVRLAAAARNLTSNDIPMMANMTPLFEEFRLGPIRRAEPLVDYPDPRPEQTYETPFGAAVVLRAMESRRKFRFFASGYPLRDGKVNFKWVAKTGGVSVWPLQGNAQRYPSARGYGELVMNWSGVRRDVLVFARYGEDVWGPPSVISFFGAPNELRRYGADGQIRSVEYLVMANVIPQLYQNKPWKDVYERDSLGNVICFLRTRSGSFRDERFSITGENVIETYAGDLPKLTAKVRYFTRPDDPLTLDFEVTDETVLHAKGQFESRARGEFPPAKRRR